MRKLLALALAGALAAVLAASALAATRTVKVGDNYFLKRGAPKTISVAKGTTLKFKWVGDAFHNVTVTKGPVKFHSPTKDTGVYRKKLKRKGTYVLVCTVHGGSQKLTVKVR